MRRVCFLFLSSVTAFSVFLAVPRPLAREINDFRVTKDFDQVNARISIDVTISPSELGSNTFHPETLRARARRSDWPTISIRNSETDEEIYPFGDEDIQIMRESVSFIISDFDRDLLESLESGERRHYIFIDKPLRLPLSPKSQEGKAIGGPITEILVITPSAMKGKTSGEAIRLLKEETEALIDARGGEAYMYSNKIDVGVHTNIADTAKREYTLSFAYSHRMKSDLVSWNTLTVKAQIGTDKDDPLNRVYIYPVGVDLYSSSRLPGQTVGRVGVEGNQKFSNGRFCADMYWQGIIPNLIDLAKERNRLRLRPVLKLGIKGFREFDNDRGEPNVISGEAYTEIYYFIPILKHYSLLLEGSGFFMFGEEVTPREDFRWNYDATLGAKMPGSDFKLIAKYSYGENNVNFVKDSRLLLGLAADLLEI